MIKRIWNGYTTPAEADAHEHVLDNFVFHRSIELLKRQRGDEVQFTTVTSFDSLDNVIAFLGEDYEAAYVPEEARKLLERLGFPFN